MYSTFKSSKIAHDAADKSPHILHGIHTFSATWGTYELLVQLTMYVFNNKATGINRSNTEGI